MWLVLACCASAFAADDEHFLAPHEVSVVITRSSGAWTAEYTFDRPVGAWFFPRSSLSRDDKIPWRPQSWTVETPGVKLVRRGSFDVLVARRGLLPNKVKLRFTPFTAYLLDDYSAALAFTDGGIALFTAQFDVFPLRDAGEAGRLPSDLNNQQFPQTHVSMSFRDGTQVTTHGGEFPAYVFLGPTPHVETADVVAIFDPQLPLWIRDSLATTVTQILGLYAKQLGQLPEGKPTVMVSWGGATPGVISRGGGALRGQIVMEYAGAGLMEETAVQRAEGNWFVAHEAAHFWLGQTAGYEYARESWITEGGADLLAVRAIASIDPTYDWRAELDRDITDCAQLTRGRGVASARERDEQRAYYACGAVFGLVAEAASGQPFHAFVQTIVDANRGDGIVSRSEWLAALDAVSKNPTLSRDIARLLDRGASDPAMFIASLLKRAGVAYRLDEQKVPHIQ
jgi:hypothetical protein